MNGKGSTTESDVESIGTPTGTAADDEMSSNNLACGYATGAAECTGGCGRGCVTIGSDVETSSGTSAGMAADDEMSLNELACGYKNATCIAINTTAVSTMRTTNGTSFGGIRVVSDCVVGASAEAHSKIAFGSSVARTRSTATSTSMVQSATCCFIAVDVNSRGAWLNAKRDLSRPFDLTCEDCVKVWVDDRWMNGPAEAALVVAVLVAFVVLAAQLNHQEAPQKSVLHGEYDHDADVNTACLTCADGSTTDTLDQTGATSCTPCSAGEYDNDLDSTTACFVCAVGSFTNTQTGATSCTPCSAGEYDDDLDSSTACLTWADRRRSGRQHYLHCMPSRDGLVYGIWRVHKLVRTVRRRSS
jgi:hypothetical protein